MTNKRIAKRRSIVRKIAQRNRNFIGDKSICPQSTLAVDTLSVLKRYIELRSGCSDYKLDSILKTDVDSEKVLSNINNEFHRKASEAPLDTTGYTTALHALNL